MAASSQPPANWNRFNALVDFSTADPRDKVRMLLAESGKSPAHKEQLLQEMILSLQIESALEENDTNPEEKIRILEQLKDEVVSRKRGGARSRRIKKRRRSTRR